MSLTFEAAPRSAFMPLAPASSAPDDVVACLKGRRRVSHALAQRLRFRPARLDLPQGMVSFSFDDFPDSAARTGGAILEDHGCRGTFYATSGQLGTRQRHWSVASIADVERLHAGGHEIGLHSHGHDPAPFLSARAFTADLAANRAALRRLLPGLKDETYAYPYGYASLGHKRRLGRLARASRSVQPGLNVGTVDLDYIRAVSLVDAYLMPGALEALLDEAAERRGWLVFLTHDVTTNPTQYGVSPGLMTTAVAGALQRGLPVRTIAGALDAMGVP